MLKKNLTAALLIILFCASGRPSVGLAQTRNAKLTDHVKALIAKSLITKAIEELKSKDTVKAIYVSTENLSPKLMPPEIAGVKIVPLTLKRIRNADDLVYLRIKSFVPRDETVEVIFGRAWIIPSGHSGYDANYYIYRKQNGEWLGEKTDEQYFSNSWGPGRTRKSPH